MRRISIENCILLLKQVVLIARVVLILCGLYSDISLYDSKDEKTEFILPVLFNDNNHTSYSL